MNYYDAYQAAFSLRYNSISDWWACIWAPPTLLAVNLQILMPRSVSNRGSRRQRISCAPAGAELSEEKARESLLPPEADWLERTSRQAPFAFLPG